MGTATTRDCDSVLPTQAQASRPFHEQTQASVRGVSCVAIIIVNAKYTTINPWDRMSLVKSMQGHFTHVSYMKFPRGSS